MTTYTLEATLAGDSGLAQDGDITAINFTLNDVFVGKRGSNPRRTADNLDGALVVTLDVTGIFDPEINNILKMEYSGTGSSIPANSLEYGSVSWVGDYCNGYKLRITGSDGSVYYGEYPQGVEYGPYPYVSGQFMFGDGDFPAIQLNATTGVLEQPRDSFGYLVNTCYIYFTVPTVLGDRYLNFQLRATTGATAGTVATVNAKWFVVNDGVEVETEMGTYASYAVQSDGVAPWRTHQIPVPWDQYADAQRLELEQVSGSNAKIRNVWIEEAPTTFSDDFNRANGAVGNDWIESRVALGESTMTWAIVSNKATCTVNDSVPGHVWDAMLLRNLGAADFTMTMTLTGTFDTNFFGGVAAWRATNVDDGDTVSYFVAYYDGWMNQLQVFEGLPAGTSGGNSWYAPLTMASGSTFTVTCEGDQHTILVNGVEILTFTSTLNQTTGKHHGLSMLEPIVYSAVTFEDFSISSISRNYGEFPQGSYYTADVQDGVLSGVAILNDGANPDLDGTWSSSSSGHTITDQSAEFNIDFGRTKVTILTAPEPGQTGAVTYTGTVTRTDNGGNSGYNRITNMSLRTRDNLGVPTSANLTFSQNPAPIGTAYPWTLTYTETVGAGSLYVYNNTDGSSPASYALAAIGDLNAYYVEQGAIATSTGWTGAGYLQYTTDGEIVTIHAYDDFTRADDPTSLGSDWTAWVGVWGIESNTAELKSASVASHPRVVRDVGASDGIYEVTLANPTAGGENMGVVFRGVDSNNFYAVDLWTTGRSYIDLTATGSCVLQRRQGGSESNITSATVTAWLPGDIVRVELSGTSIVLKRVRAGVTTTILSSTQSTFQTGTYFGFHAFNAADGTSVVTGDSKWDTFSFTSVNNTNIVRQNPATWWWTRLRTLIPVLRLTNRDDAYGLTGGQPRVGRESSTSQQSKTPRLSERNTYY